MKSKKLKILTSTLVVAIIGSVFTGCSGNEESLNGDKITVSITGSTSVGPLMEKVQEVYESKNSNTVLEIQQNGSGAGIKDAINGVNEIGMSSREIKESETGIDKTVIAHDGIALLVHPSNTVKNLTVEQLKDIYTGKIKNWKEVGGKDTPIVVVSREEGSGTRDAFQEIVKYKSEELTKDATIVDGSGAVKTTVNSNENAIGFASFEYIDSSVKALSINGVNPTAEDVKNGSYKISRPFILVTNKNTLTENGKKLIDFILSDEGQQIVTDNKLISIK